MKVTVSCAGRFHAYDLASQLNRFNILERVITSYPKAEVSKYGIPRDKVTSLLFWEVLNRARYKWSNFTRTSDCYLQPFLNELFDFYAAKRIPRDTQIYIGWSSKAERGLKMAKELGAITILERGSSHIEYQTEILMEEHELYNKRGHRCVTHQKVIDKELREYNAADFISVPSTFVSRTFIQRGFPESKIIRNPYGVNLKAFQPGIKLDKVFRVIYVGQMSLRKGTHYLLQAFHELHLANSELMLIGSMTEEIEPYFIHYSKSFTYLGVKPQADLTKYYNQSSVFVICSIEEGMAMVQIQAMACGLPVICTTNSGGDDIIQNGREGFVVPIRDVVALKERIIWMYEHQDESRDMGELAREKVSNSFSWNDYGKRYYDFIATQVL